MPNSSKGFSIVELMIAVAISSIVGVLALVNYNSFGEAQKIKNGANDIKSLIRIAEVNAASNNLCFGVGNQNWIITFTSATTIDLKCGPSETVVKTLDIAHGNLSEKMYNSDPSQSTCETGNTTKIIFEPVTAKITITYPAGSICTLADKLWVKLSSSKVTDTVSVVIDRGGTIDVK